MGICEANALSGKSIHVGSRDLRVRVVTSDIAIPHIIGHNEDYVGSISHMSFVSIFSLLKTAVEVAILYLRPVDLYNARKSVGDYYDFFTLHGNHINFNNRFTAPA